MKEVTGSVSGFLFEGTISHICVASSAHDKCKTKNCTVILVDITKGKIATGEKISVTINGKTVEDTVARIELQKKEVVFAQEGDGVGICLVNAKLEDFPPEPVS